MVGGEEVIMDKVRWCLKCDKWVAIEKKEENCPKCGSQFQYVVKFEPVKFKPCRFRRGE